jgi:TFIIS helical bundle-like domain
MDKYLLQQSAGQSTRKPSKPKQQRLAQCKQTVLLSASKYVVDDAELRSLCEILDNANSTHEAVHHALRHLDALVFDIKSLTRSQVGVSVKRMRQHPDSSVSRLAAGMIKKWRAQVKTEASSGRSK